VTTSSHSYLICPSCGRHYFNHAEARHCPHCGHRLRWSPKYLKVWVSAAIVVALLIIALVEIAGGW
jgi:uncharacterized paraquat-inducible protein A